MSHTRGVLVALEVYELCIEHCVEYGLVAEDFFDVNQIACFVVLHRRFPVSERVERYLLQSWILEFEYDLFTLFVKVSSHQISRDSEDSIGILLNGFQHAYKFG